MFFLNSLHKDFKSYEALISLHRKNNLCNYTIEYPEISRKITINFESIFPYKITEWEETYESGYGKTRKNLQLKLP